MISTIAQQSNPRPGDQTPPPAFTRVLPFELLPPVPDIRVRSTPEQLEFTRNLGADILARGIQVPLICYDDEGRPRIEDGETRRQAMLLVGYTKPVPILLYPAKPSTSALLIGSLQANALRKDMSEQEYAEVYQQLMRLNGWTPAELFRQLHINPGTGHKRLAISTKLCERVKALVAESKLAVRAAYTISRIPDETTQIDLAEKCVRGDLCVEGVEAEVARILRRGKQPAKGKARTLKIGDIEVTLTPSASLECVATAFEGAAATAKKLLKEHKGIDHLALEYKST